MTTLTDLINDLTAATDQMHPAALGNDWELVERLQKRRRVLIDTIVARTEREPITEADAERLRAVQRQEAMVAALARTRRRALAQAIAQLPKTVRSDNTLSRMQRAYRDGSG